MLCQEAAKKGKSWLEFPQNSGFEAQTFGVPEGVLVPAT
jgi:hypothetical protein